MSGGKLSRVKVILRNPLNKAEQFDYEIDIADHKLGRDWSNALEEILRNQLHLEKNFCFLGFPTSPRDIAYLCRELNQHVDTINMFNLTKTWQQQGLSAYYIEEYFIPETVQWPAKLHVSHPECDEHNNVIEMYQGLNPKHDMLNRLHNHFERLQGTVWNPSQYYHHADRETKYAIRQLNLLCHELENAILGNRKLSFDPEWIRPSQITTFLHARRYNLDSEHRQGFTTNGYDRKIGHVYLHWAQIGKTLFEVWRDEGAPDLNVGTDPSDISIGSGATCEAINSLKYYSGEFDIEWGNDVAGNNGQYWHDNVLAQFRNWLEKNGVNYDPEKYSLGYLELGKINLQKAFGTTQYVDIWHTLGKHLDIYKIEFNGITATYDYCWSDSDFKEQQLKTLGI